MMFRSSTYTGNRQSTVYVKGTPIDTFIVTKFLGVGIDYKPTWKDDVNIVIKYHKVLVSLKS